MSYFCPVCFTNCHRDEGNVLNCHHFLCHNCLYLLLQSNKKKRQVEFTCPYCRQIEININPNNPCLFWCFDSLVDHLLFFENIVIFEKEFFVNNRNKLLHYYRYHIYKSKVNYLIKQTARKIGRRLIVTNFSDGMNCLLIALKKADYPFGKKLPGLLGKYSIMMDNNNDCLSNDNDNEFIKKEKVQIDVEDLITQFSYQKHQSSNVYVDSILFLNPYSLNLLDISLGSKFTLKYQDEYIGDVNLIQDSYSNSYKLSPLNNDTSVPFVNGTFDCFTDYFKAMAILYDVSNPFLFQHLYLVKYDESYQSMHCLIPVFRSQAQSYIDFDYGINCICGSLGIKESFVLKFSKFIDSSQTIVYWSQYILQMAIESFDNSFEISSIKDFSYYQSIDTNLNHHNLSSLSMNYFNSLYINYGFEYPKHLCESFQPILDPNNPHQRRVNWQGKRISEKSLSEINLKIHESINEYCLINNINCDNYNFFYHGTIALHAFQILDNDIQLALGSRNLDFSYKNGFYVFEGDYSMALKWTSKHPREWNAIIVFLIPKVSWNELNGLNLNLDDQLWMDTIKYYRLTTFSRFDKNHDKDYITGPICKNIPLKDKDPIKLLTENNIPFVQYCLKTNKSVNLFNTSQHRLIFFYEIEP